MANSNHWKKHYYGKKKNDYGLLKVKPGCNLKVRLVGDPVKIVRVFTNDDRCITLDNEGTAQKLKEKYPNAIYNISVRYACWCFDRQDDGMKILEMPVSVISAIGDRVALTGKKISDMEEGCDWKISTNGERGIDVRYKVSYLEKSYLTDIERNIVADQKLDKVRPYDLTKMFPGCGFQEAAAKLSKPVH